MGIDEGVLRWVENSSQKHTVVRFYGWAVPTISLGRHQEPEESVDVVQCRQAGISVVHRPTGGRAVFHDDELTYSLVSNDARYFPLTSIGRTYHVIAVALKKGLERLGVSVQFAQAFRDSRDNERSEVKKPCFLTPSRHELVSEGRKIAGNAQKRLKSSFLQHGSIPLRANYARMATALGTEQRVLERSLISVSEAVGREVSFQTVCQALIAGFEQSFGVRLVASRFDEILQSCDFSLRIASD